MTTLSPEMQTALAPASAAVAPAPPAEPAGAPQPPAADPRAPFGRTPSGRARTRPLSGKRGRPRGSSSRTSVIGAKGSQRPRSAGKGPTDYAPAILHTVQMLALPLSFRSPVDAYCITAHFEGDGTAQNPGIARAVSNLAHEYPQVAAALDKLAAVGPVGDVISATLPLVVQLVVNHGKLPLSVGAKLGATDPAVIAEALTQRGEQLAAQQAA